ncbi:hypothetical protein FXF50_26675 [Micromonospora sp. AP08]|uniref:hypothetical protein n=1 Tax=Micromonospora sp. AP08 TaxID=2604467 RepID=UPI0011D7F07F|nr:hypothetical protein [Micromonospora sp. AP08]TYB34797.1 hypothetical protein FXF50_26675 [Micromonospora sp. AP08]
MRTWAIAVTAVAATLVAIPVTTALAMGYYPRPDCFDRAPFDEVVTKLPPPPALDAFDSVDAPDKIGSCDIGSSYGVKGGYIFYAVDSPGLDDSGWGYFPNGPDGDLGNGEWEGPQFERIEGPWYHWTASW